MKFLLVGVLFLASIAYIKAEFEDINDLEKCRADRDACLKAAVGNFKQKLECFIKFQQCRPRPTRPRPSFEPRPTLPDYEVQCKRACSDCLKNSKDDIKEKLNCINGLRKCLLHNRPSRIRPRL